MININRLTQTAVLNRLLVHGPTEELQRFKNAALSKATCDCCGKEFLVLEVPESTDSGRLGGGFRLELVSESKKSLVLECEADERAPIGFIAGLAERWPKLEFALECWAYSDGFTCCSVNEASQPCEPVLPFGLK